jgi:hypothetical protein
MGSDQPHHRALDLAPVRAHERAGTGSGERDNGRADRYALLGLDGAVPRLPVP